MSPRLNHICLHVKNLDDCVRFYQQYCGMQIIGENVSGGEGSIFMSAADLKNEFIIQLKSDGENLTLPDKDERHFGFSVSEKSVIDEIADRARNESILFWEPGEYTPGAHICAVKDPNGNTVEFGYRHTLPPA